MATTTETAGASYYSVGTIKLMVLSKAVAFAYLFLNFLWRQPNPWWVAGTASVIPLILAPRHIDPFVPPAVAAARHRFGMGSVATIAVGLIFWALIIIGMTVPNTRPA